MHIPNFLIMPSDDREKGTPLPTDAVVARDSIAAALDAGPSATGEGAGEAINEARLSMAVRHFAGQIEEMPLSDLWIIGSQLEKFLYDQGERRRLSGIQFKRYFDEICRQAVPHEKIIDVAVARLRDVAGEKTPDGATWLIGKNNVAIEVDKAAPWLLSDAFPSGTNTFNGIVEKVYTRLKKEVRNE